MTQTEIRNGFNQMIAAAADKGDAGAVARIELAREYFCNSTFKAALQDFVWKVNQAEA